MYELKKKLERYLRVNLFGPGPLLLKKEFTGPRSHKGWETLVYIVWKLHVSALKECKDAVISTVNRPTTRGILSAGRRTLLTTTSLKVTSSYYSRWHCCDVINSAEVLTFGIQRWSLRQLPSPAIWHLLFIYRRFGRTRFMNFRCTRSHLRIRKMINLYQATRHTSKKMGFYVLYSVEVCLSNGPS